jgi:Putative collagen-binding domain of a collagenase
VRAWWYDPRTGIGTLLGTMPGKSHREFCTPPYGPDWVLVIDAPEAGYEPPGLAPLRS